MFTFCSHSLEHMMYGIGRIVLELLTAPHVECGSMSEWLLESRPFARTYTISSRRLVRW
jgi:hypothetical protein